MGTLGNGQRSPTWSQKWREHETVLGLQGLGFYLAEPAKSAKAVIKASWGPPKRREVVAFWALFRGIGPFCCVYSYSLGWGSGALSKAIKGRFAKHGACVFTAQFHVSLRDSEGPSTQGSKTLVPKTITWTAK